MSDPSSQSIQTATAPRGADRSGANRAARDAHPDSPPTFDAVLDDVQRRAGLGWKRELAGRVPKAGLEDDSADTPTGRRVRELIDADHAEARSDAAVRAEPAKPTDAADSNPHPEKPAPLRQAQPPAAPANVPSTPDHSAATAVRPIVPCPARAPCANASSSIQATTVVENSDRIGGDSAPVQPAQSYVPQSGSSVSSGQIVADRGPSATPVVNVAGASLQNAVDVGAEAAHPPGIPPSRDVSAFGTHEPQIAAGAAADGSGAGSGAALADDLEPGNAQPAHASAAESGETSEPTRPTFERLVQSIRAQMAGRESHARIRLDPPALGPMRIDMKISGDKVALRLETETSAARELLGARLDDLRSALAQHGLSVERVELRDLAPAPNSSAFYQRDSGQAAAFLNHDAQPDGSRERSSGGARSESIVRPRALDPGEPLAPIAWRALSGTRVGASPLGLDVTA